MEPNVIKCHSPEVKSRNEDPPIKSVYIQLDKNANQNKREIDDEFIRRYVLGIFASAGNLPLKMQVPFTRDSPN